MLVGYDGSASADQALALVAGLAWPAPSECRIVVACGMQIETYAPNMVADAATLLVNNGMPLEEVSRYLGHSPTDVTRRYAQQTPDALGRRAADALARAGLVAS